MKRFLAAMAAVFLSACTTVPDGSIVGDAQVRPSEDPLVAVGTLAPLGSFEWAVAPEYTRAARIARAATVALRRGWINTDIAVQISTQGREAVRKLDEAVRLEREGQPARANGLVAEARKILDTLDKTLSEARK